MAVSEEYLAVEDLTPLSTPTEDDQFVVQTSGQGGDVMLLPISGLISMLQESFAALESPEFLGMPTVPEITDTTASDLQIANTAFVQAVAESKANVNNPEFSGTASFPEAVPTTVDGDGNLVEVATKTDITNLTHSIESMTESINALSSALTSLIMTKMVFQEDNQTIGANGEYARTSIDISEPGYQPLGIVGFGIYNASSGGANATYCVPTRFITWGNSTLDLYVWNQHQSQAAKVKIFVRALYVKIPSDG